MASEDFLEVDNSIPGQSYTCISFVSPEEVIKKKNLQFVNKFLKTIAPKYDLDAETIEEKYKDFLYLNEEKLQEEFNQENDFRTSVRGVKIRGVYSSLKEAQHRAGKLQKLDPTFNVYIGQVGYWLPWDPRPDKIDTQEYAEGELNELVKKYKENQDNKDIHFRENIDYIKKQAAATREKKKEENVRNKVDKLLDVDPWLKQKEESVQRVNDES